MSIEIDDFDWNLNSKFERNARRFSSCFFFMMITLNGRVSLHMYNDTHRKNEEEIAVLQTFRMQKKK